MNPDDLDIKVLDLLADDYYGLWEVCDYAVGATPSADAEAALIACRQRVKVYFDEGLIDVFVGPMTKDQFRRVSNENAMKLLSESISWAKPERVREVVAVSLTAKGKALLAHVADS